MGEPVYDRIGGRYAQRRRAEPRIAAALLDALGDARSVVNIGAGAGSYEPLDRPVIAVEPSTVMIAQRPRGAAPCVRATAEALPFRGGHFDAAMAILTLHHWRDWRGGLNEARRVARRRFVLLAFDVEAPGFWLTCDYLPALAALDRAIMPPLTDLEAVLGPCDVRPLLVPHDCRDGFLGAYWRRPEMYLDPDARAAISSFARIDATEGLARLAADLENGAWAARHGGVLASDALDIGYRILRWDFA